MHHLPGKNPLFCVVALNFLSALVIVGCGGTEQTGNPAPLPTKQSKNQEPEKPKKAKDPADDVVKWDRSNIDTAEIPEDIPVYPKAKAKRGNSAPRMFVMFWETKDSKKDVMEFYRTELVAKGWEIKNDLSHGRMDAEKDRQKLIISFASGTKQPTSILVRLSR